ncbi:MAG: hypothetical protein FWG67_01050 [Defluviitaleaceae bacterium]|nr:hypothetical protein [Defluviitaleaceae bacterium]
MDYFILKQDPDLNHTARIRSGGKMSKAASVSTKVVYVEDQLFKDYPDFYERPGLLIAKKFKKVLGLYQPEIKFQTVVLVDKKEKHQVSYDLLQVPTVDCVSEESEFRFDKIITLVLDLQLVGDYRVFKVKGYGNQLVVRLDVAESLLRRGAYGIIFEKVKIKKQEMV